MNLLLDTGILGQLCHPSKVKFQPLRNWLTRVLSLQEGSYRAVLPEVCDYELRRKLMHLIRKGQASPKSIHRLDEFTRNLVYLPIDTETMRKAAELWAEARSRGLPTASDQSLDADAILAAQAVLVDGTIVTSNRKHLSQFVAVKEWTELANDMP